MTDRMLDITPPKKARGPASSIPFGEVTILEGETAGAKLAENLVHEMGGDLDGTTRDGGLLVPISLLMSVVTASREDGLPFTLDPATEARLAKNMRHGLMTLTRIYNSDGREYVRSRTNLTLTDDPQGAEPWEEFVDIPTELVGQMFEVMKQQAAHREAQRLTGGGGWGMPRLSATVPTWAGSHSYAPVLEQARKIGRVQPLHIGRMDNAPRQVLSLSEASALLEAHVIRVDPAQVAVLPEWGSDEEAVEFAIDALLPFDVIYLDFEGPGGIRPRVIGTDAYDQPVTISGALMFRGQEGHLTVSLIGWPEENFSRPDPKVAWNRYESAGWFVFDPKQMLDTEGKPRHLGDIPLVLDGANNWDTGCNAMIIATDYCATSLSPDGVTDETWEPAPDRGLPGYAIIPAERQDMIRHLGTDKAVTELIWRSHLLWLLVKRALAALSIVEAEEVVLADAPMERRDRKRAEKRGWPIAQQVFIRPSRRYSERNPPSGEEAHYSHRFWVRGHYKHFPLGSRLATHRPDLVKPCPRTDLATNCGFCRRIWTPPFIKGPEDAPLVLKTLIQKKRKVT